MCAEACFIGLENTEIVYRSHCKYCLCSILILFVIIAHCLEVGLVKVFLRADGHIGVIQRLLQVLVCRILRRIIWDKRVFTSKHSHHLCARIIFFPTEDKATAAFLVAPYGTGRRLVTAAEGELLIFAHAWLLRGVGRIGHDIIIAASRERKHGQCA